MRALICAIFLGLSFSTAVTEAETVVNPSAKCQQLAHDYAENPELLEAVRLKQLQFCINQTLAQRKKNDPPKMLKGTIIEPLIPPGSSSFPATPDLQSGGKD